MDKKANYAIRLDAEACKGCGYCALACARGVYARAEGFNARGYRFFEAARPEECVGCLRCFYLCPDFCLELSAAAPAACGGAA